MKIGLFGRVKAFFGLVTLVLVLGAASRGGSNRGFDVKYVACLFLNTIRWWRW